MGHCTEKHHASSLVSGSQRNWDEVKEGGYAEQDLDVGHGERSTDSGKCQRREGGACDGTHGMHVEGGGAEVGRHGLSDRCLSQVL